MIRKYYCLLVTLAFCWGLNAQTLNQSANWPNAAWTITGSYNTDPLAFESDPTTTANFAFDDDDAGNPHNDNIAAESPVINLTAAHTAGENSVEIAVNYGYRRTNTVEILRFEYWNADTAAWVAWSNIPSNNTSITDNFCTIPKTFFVTSALNIAAFTPTQLAGFRYRIFYDDDPAGSGWQYGFCFDSPTIQSISCEAPSGFVMNDVIDESATINWAVIPGVSTFEYVLDQINTDPAGSGTPISGNTYEAEGLSAVTTYYFHIRTICGTTQSPWRTATFTTTTPPLENDLCSTATDLTNLTSPLSATTVGSLNNNLNVCNNSGQSVANTQGDVYYSIQVPNGSTLNIGQTVNNYDSANVVFYGSCAAPTQIACFDDDDYTQVVWANNTGSTQTVYWVQDGWSGTGTFTLAWSIIACTQPTATYTIVPDCMNGDQFLVSVNITSLGSATSLTVVDDQGTPSTVVSATGTVSFGPYPNGSPVVISIANDQDGDCYISSPALNQTVCPPVNDTCANAIDLANETSPLSSTTVGANNNNLTVCNTGGPVANTHSDVYYSIAVPNGSTLSIGQTVNNYDSANVVFYGSCASPTQIACFDDPDDTTVEWANETGSTQTVYWVQDGWSGTGTFTLQWSLIACTPPEATFTVVSDCTTADQFMVDVNITSLGSATSLTVVDDQGTPSEVVTAVGTLSFGPYPNGTAVGIAIANDQNGDCFLQSPVLNQLACPPANDECATAVALTVNADYACTAVTAGTTLGATASSQPDDVSGTPNNDVWYSFQALATAHRVSLLNVTVIAPSTSTDMGMGVYNGSGGCGALTFTATSDPNTLDLTGLTIGTTYYVRVYGWGSAISSTNFNICIGTPPPPPTNDNFADAIAIQCDNTYAGDTTLATLDQDSAPDGGGADLDARNVWYSYTGTGTPQTVTLDLCGSGYDTSVLVYTGTAGNLSFVAANDDAGEGTCGVGLGSRSFLNFNSDGTTTYYITIEGWNASNFGAFSMDVSCAAVIPPAVPNQTCALALGIPVDGTVINSDNSYGTVNAVQPSCDLFGSVQDVWFSFVAPASGSVECAITNDSMASVNFNIYSGSCGTLVPVTGTCNADLPAGGSEDLTGLVSGNTYYVQVWSNATEQGTFSITVTDEDLGVVDNTSAAFKAYPNPVKDILNLSHAQHITDVAIFNLVGQQVIVKSINATQGQVDMSNLASGTYLVKVSSDNQIKTFKVIKQ